MYLVSVEARRGPRTGLRGGCEPPGECWGLIPHPLQEQEMLLNTGASLQPDCVSVWFLPLTSDGVQMIQLTRQCFGRAITSCGDLRIREPGKEPRARRPITFDLEHGCTSLAGFFPSVVWESTVEEL